MYISGFRCFIVGATSQSKCHHRHIRSPPASLVNKLSLRPAIEDSGSITLGSIGQSTLRTPKPPPTTKQFWCGRQDSNLCGVFRNLEWTILSAARDLKLILSGADLDCYYVDAAASSPDMLLIISTTVVTLTPPSPSSSTCTKSTAFA